MAPSTPHSPSGGNTSTRALEDDAYDGDTPEKFARTLKAHLPRYQVPNSVKAQDCKAFLQANPSARRKDYVHPSEKEDCVQPELYKKEVCKAFLYEYPDVYYQYAEIFCDLDVSIHAVKKALNDPEAWKNDIRAHIKRRYKGGFVFGSSPPPGYKPEPRPTTGKFVVTPEEISASVRAVYGDSVDSVASHYRRDYTADMNESRRSAELKPEDVSQPDGPSRSASNTGLDVSTTVVPASFGRDKVSIYGNTYSQPQYPAPRLPLPPIPSTKSRGNNSIKPKRSTAAEAAVKEEYQSGQPASPVATRYVLFLFLFLAERRGIDTT